MGWIGYTRVSRIGEREGESFISPQAQREAIEGWAKLRHVEVGWWLEDLDVSGGKLDRPGLDEAMDLIRSGQAEGIAVAKLDRLSRAGVADALNLVAEIQECGAQLAAVDLGIDPTTPFGEFGLTLMLALARMERRRIADNWSTAQELAIQRGIYIASKAPTGYDRVGGRLTPSRDADAVGDMFRLRARGASWRECADLLNKRGVVGPWGEGVWRTDAVQLLVSNRAYLGVSAFGKFENPEAHEPLIDEDAWSRAQRAPSPPVPRNGEGALLTGLVRCSGCSYRLKPSTRTQRGEKVRIYECGKHHASGDCPSPASALGRVLEPHVIDWFRSVIGSPEFIAQDSPSESDELLDTLRAAESDVQVYRDSPGIIQAIGMESYLDGLRSRQSVVDEIERKLRELPSDSLDSLTVVDLFDNGTTEDRRELLSSVIGTIFVRNLGKRAPIKKRALLLRHDDVPSDLPKRGHKNTIRSFSWPLD